jgi:hypothetical protein
MTKESLLLLKQGISDWLVTDCADLHDPESVVKSRERIDQEGGVIGYTANLFEVIDGLLKEEVRRKRND